MDRLLQHFKMRNALLREIHQREDPKRLVPLLAKLLEARIRGGQP